MILLILIFLFHSTTTCVSAVNTQNIYARILFDQVYLYKSADEDNSINNIYFELPKTYFVELIDKSGDFYKAKYLNLTGYVKKDCVQAINGTPSNPFLDNINFRVYAQMSENVFSFPTLDSDIITQIPPLTNNIQYLGKIVGDCLIEDRTNIWYYCKYSDKTDYYGYVYSDFCDKMSTISDNIEEVEYINNPTFETEIEPINAIPKNSNTVGIIIGIISIPALIFVFMIIKGTRIMNNEKVKRGEIVDY